MLSLPSTVRIHAAVEPVDLRKGFDSLSCLVREVLAADPLSGHLFVFFNRRSDQTKILFWARNGYCLFHKRLERGRFHLPSRISGAPTLRLEAAELHALLDGIDLRNAQLKPAWIPPAQRGEASSRS